MALDRILSLMGSHNIFHMQNSDDFKMFCDHTYEHPDVFNDVLAPTFDQKYQPFMKELREELDGTLTDLQIYKILHLKDHYEELESPFLEILEEPLAKKIIMDPEIILDFETTMFLLDHLERKERNRFKEEMVSEDGAFSNTELQIQSILMNDQDEKEEKLFQLLFVLYRELYYGKIKNGHLPPLCQIDHYHFSLLQFVVSHYHHLKVAKNGRHHRTFSCVKGPFHLIKDRKERNVLNLYDWAKAITTSQAYLKTLDTLTQYAKEFPLSKIKNMVAMVEKKLASLPPCRPLSSIPTETLQKLFHLTDQILRDQTTFLLENEFLRLFYKENGMRKSLTEWLGEMKKRRLLLEEKEMEVNQEVLPLTDKETRRLLRKEMEEFDLFEQEIIFLYLLEQKVTPLERTQNQEKIRMAVEKILSLRPSGLDKNALDYKEGNITEEVFIERRQKLASDMQKALLESLQGY